jgi:type VI secretion system lysozyme-like protein
VSDDSIQRLGYKAKEEARYKPYILKRLTDYDPSVKKETETGAITLRQVREDVLENVEMLFTSRAHLSEVELKDDRELISSVLGFGITDYCGMSFSDTQRELLKRHIAEQLAFFEPRLDPSSISVEFVHEEDNPAFLMEFKISGVIRFGQISEELLFVSKLNLETGGAEITSLKE